MRPTPRFQPPNRRRIFLLRHAEAAYVAADGTVTDEPRQVGLTENGRIQARKQAGVLASVRFDRAICSGLPRTVETANLVLAGREHPRLETEPALEEIRGGDLTGYDLNKSGIHLTNMEETARRIAESLGD